MAAVALCRSTEPKAADSEASNGCGFGASERTISINRSMACASVITSTTRLWLLVARTSVTTNVSKFVPGGKVTTATAPVANGVAAPALNQKNCKASPSGSVEREASRITVGLQSKGAIAMAGMAVATAIGGRLRISSAFELITVPNAFVTRTE